MLYKIDYIVDGKKEYVIADIDSEKFGKIQATSLLKNDRKILWRHHLVVTAIRMIDMSDVLPWDNIRVTKRMKRKKLTTYLDDMEAKNAKL